MGVRIESSNKVCFYKFSNSLNVALKENEQNETQYKCNAKSCNAYYGKRPKFGRTERRLKDVSRIVVHFETELYEMNDKVVCGESITD